ncbi:MAG: hypothetical protein HC919_08690 [Oscillatoriales cyanobacterium SM2_2_1]|nr:hypothetical protein [Oscillatoriales cyanobacterium SM2_2_1]
MSFESYALLTRLIGFGLLILIGADLIELIMTVQLTDPSSEFRAIGRLIESVWFPLTAFVLIFFPYSENFREVRILAWLSYLPLAFAILYFLSVPLLIVNTSRLYNLGSFNLTRGIEAIDRELGDRQAFLEKVPDERLRQQAEALRKDSITDLTTIQEVRTLLNEELSRSAAQTKEQIQANVDASRGRLLRSTVKWLLGALVSGVAMIYIWRYSLWARRQSKFKPE